MSENPADPPPRTLRQFYEHPGRADSPERSFGDSWREGGHGPWRVSWIEYTGELAAFALGPTGLEGAGISGLTSGDIAFDLVVGAALGRAGRGDEVRILGVEYDETKLCARIEGWEAHEPDENGLDWLRERLTRS